MKKIFVLILCLVALTSCSFSSENPTASTSENSDDVLIMATNAYFPPYEYYDGNKIVGIDVDIAEAIAKKLGQQLKVEDMEFDSVITSVSTGKADIGLAGITVTDDRLQNINFSDTYATAVQSVIVKSDSDIKKLEDLSKKMIGVQLNTTADILAVKDYGKNYVNQYNNGNDAIIALTSGKIDAVIIDNEPAKNFVTANKNLKILDTNYAVEKYAICIAKENTELLEKINNALAELNADGTLKKIVDNYILTD